MANAKRQNGEVSVEIDGKTYVLAMTIDSMVALEELFSTPAKSMTFQDVIDRSDKGSITHLRGLLWSVLQTHHPDVGIKDVSVLVQNAGGLGAITVKLMELAKATQADPKDLEALGVKPDANPPQAQDDGKTSGTGEGSTSSLVASV